MLLHLNKSRNVRVTAAVHSDYYLGHGLNVCKECSADCEVIVRLPNVYRLQALTHNRRVLSATTCSHSVTPVATIPA